MRTHFTITHPFHPHRGQRRELVQSRRCRTGERIYFQVEEGGRVESLPRGWTDLARPDPFVEQSGGRAWFRVGELLDLVHLIESVQKKAEEGGTDV
ncbi:MAG: hypothetical protein GY742_05370 [Hyphomicrobiales bacterium]|nr:hypothetical protein [Hyphomicrobiales bacterium]